MHPFTVIAGIELARIFLIWARTAQDALAQFHIRFPGPQISDLRPSTQREIEIWISDNPHKYDSIEKILRQPEFLRRKS